MIGFGALLNALTIVVGAALGVLLGSKLPEKTNRTVTEALGIFSIIIGGFDVMALNNQYFVDEVHGPYTMVIVILAVLFGTIAGSLLKIETGLEKLGAWLHARLQPKSADHAEGSHRFIAGFVNASLLMAIGPMAILGSLEDGLGLGAHTLTIKAILDGFASIAFAASLGWGVAASALTVGAWEGLLTLMSSLGAGDIGEAYVSAITATGGVLMIAIGVRLMGIRAIAVADLLPSLLLAPLFTWVAASWF